MEELIVHDVYHTCVVEVLSDWFGGLASGHMSNIRTCEMYSGYIVCNVRVVQYQRS